MYQIVISDEVGRSDIPKLGSEWENKIKPAIKSKLSLNPQIFGKPLQGFLKNYRRLRVGDYRVIYRIEGNFVRVALVGHRSVAYKIAQKRL